MSLQDLQQNFFQDPRWAEVEALIRGYIEPLIDLDSIDTTQSSEQIKAEIIGRKIAYKSMKDFLENTRVLTRPLKEIKNPFD